jgi:hypothetical protein
LHFCTNLHYSYISCIRVRVFCAALHLLRTFTAHCRLFDMLAHAVGPSSAKLDHMQQPQAHRCACPTKCGGVLKPVSRATYFRHGKYCSPQAVFDETLTKVIQGNSTGSNTSAFQRDATHNQSQFNKSVKRRRIDEDTDESVFTVRF